MWMKYCAAGMPEVQLRTGVAQCKRRVFKAPRRLCPGELRRMQGENEMGGDEEEARRRERRGLN